MPNLYPAFERHEVVVHTPEHRTSLAELSTGELAVVAEAWASRAQAAREEGFGYVHALVNDGRSSGASREHTHSQLVWLREPPPAVAAELPSLAAGSCALCALLTRDDLAVAERPGVRMLAAPAGRLPYELLIAPTAHAAAGLEAGEALAQALDLAAEGLRRVRALRPDAPANAWLHEGGHWHLELVPRLAELGGIELGAGIYVNTATPEDAARALRDAR